MIKVSFDIGGVLSKRPEVWGPILHALESSSEVEVHIITDMPPGVAIDSLEANGFVIPRERLHCADYEKHGEACKAVLLRTLGMDMHVDDYPGYVAEGDGVRLLVMPDLSRPYNSPNWKRGTSEATG